MALRTSLLLAIAASALLLGVAYADGDYPDSDYPHKKHVCFYKKQKCCYKFYPCGYEVKKIPIQKRCDFKKCEDKCKKECDTKKEKVAYKQCYNKPVKVYKLKCKYNDHDDYKTDDDTDDEKYDDDTDDDDKYDDDKYDRKSGWYKKEKKNKKCKKVLVIKHKKVCVIKYKYVEKPYCEKKCYKVCYLYKAICKGYKVVKYEKFCPKLKCGDLEIEGKEPKVDKYVGKKEIDVDEKYDDKKVIGKELVKEH